ncbi:MAG: hypothetical protein JNM62_09335 [Flavobacteriales bacterium]|nr:hypothetical protein [Flavobacteriales bacterium]
MSDQHEFDELARRKLDERRFPLEEEDWLAAQRLIEARHPVRNGRRNTIIIAALLLIGAALWWMRPGKDHAALTDNGHANDNVPVQQGTSSEERVPATVAVVPDEPYSKRDVTDRSSASSGDAPRNVDTAPSLSPRAGSPSGGRPLNEAPTTSTVRPPLRIPPERTNAEPAPNSNKSEHLKRPGGNPTEPEVAATAVGTGSLALTEPMPTEPALATADLESDGGAVTSSDDALGIVRPPTSNQTEEPAGNSYYSSADSAVMSITTTRDTVPLNATSMDTTSVDSTTVPPRLAPPDPATSPWHLSVLGGASHSNSTYSGGTSDLWRDGSRSRWAPTFAAEVMHMGRVFGVGAGVHHVTYAEDLDVRSQTTTTTSIRDSSYFQSVDTTLMVVVGTTQIGGQTYYITQPFQTTVQTLVSGTATTISTQELVRAMKATNRISYVEIPLFFDAHLDKGDWAVGLRGGPTVGLLTGRRGALPSAVSDGSFSSNERTFKSTVFGATGRAYVRYRFCSGWAVGLEPQYRMQFGDALGGGDIQRCNAGWGGMLSLTYRLR